MNDMKKIVEILSLSPSFRVEEVEDQMLRTKNMKTINTVDRDGREVVEVVPSGECFQPLNCCDGYGVFVLLLQSRVSGLPVLNDSFLYCTEQKPIQRIGTRSIGLEHATFSDDFTYSQWKQSQRGTPIKERSSQCGL